MFDTLVSALDEPQVEAVLAHEIGHEKRRHVIKHLILSLLLTLAGLWLLSVLLHQPELFAAFGFHLQGVAGPAPTPPSSSCRCWQVRPGPSCSPWRAPGPGATSMRPTATAARAVGGDEALAGALIALSRDNLSNPNPHPWYSAYHYSIRPWWNGCARCAAMPPPWRRRRPSEPGRGRRSLPVAAPAGANSAVGRGPGGCERRVASGYNERVPCRTSRGPIAQLVRAADS